MGAVSAREEEIRAAMQRVLESKYFAQAESLSSLLRYLVEETLAGRGATVKELTIGCEVFARGMAFDPKTDGIVRVQASRMRGKLRDYYAAEGRNDQVVIAVPAGGYAAEFLPNNQKDVPKRKPAPRWVLWAVAAGVLSAALVLLAGMWKSTPAKIQSVAVLPFRNLTGDPEHNFLADGLTDGLITNLGKIPGLRVTSRTTSMSLAGTKKPLTAIARDLNVDALVEGSMNRAGGNISVNVNLIDARGGERNLWSRTGTPGARFRRSAGDHESPGSRSDPSGFGGGFHFRPETSEPRSLCRLFEGEALGRPRDGNKHPAGDHIV